MNEYNKFNDLIKNKSILYIPIYSCFDYQTGNLNFKADGNINRFLSTFSHCNSFKYLNILYPPEGNNIDWFEESCKMISDKITLLPCEHIVKSAKIERSLEFADKVYSELKCLYCLYEYDYIIVEAQHLFLKLHDNGFKNLIYWCPVCATDDKTRDFLEPYKEIDKFIFSISKNTIVASKDQVDYYNEYQFKGNLIQIESLINRNLPFFEYKENKEIINLFNKYKNLNKFYFPFRLTDKGYKTQEIIDYLYKEYKSYRGFKVFYSNPNECDIYQFANQDSYKKTWLDEYFIRVSKDRDTYYTIIDKCEVIIPYFEDIDFIRHAAIDEFKYGNCKVINTLEEFKKIK